MKCLLKICAVGLVIVSVLPKQSQARTWRVEKDGSGDFTVIQNAVDASADGDTVKIGPGRYSEYTDHTYAGNVWHNYVHMVAGSLTLVGAGEDVTVIGPELPGTWQSWEYAVGAFFWPTNASSALLIAQLTVEDTVEGVYAESGRVTANHCTNRRTRLGVWTHTPAMVDSCLFDRVSDYGVIASSPSHDFSITECEFIDSDTAFYFSGVANVTVSGCQVVNCLNAGGMNQCSGSFTRNTLLVTLGGGLAVWGPGSYAITGNTFDGGGANIYFDLGADNVDCAHNVFRGSRDTAIDIVSCTPRITNNDIFKGRGSAVILGGFAQLPDRVVDMTGNYWGATSLDSISAWIVDGYDIVSPQMHGFVNFQPFSSVPVPTKKTSFGGVKAMFR